MSRKSQKQKAQDFLALHTRGELLILPNIWNPIGARILQAKGYPAVATASAAVSASLGYQDGEKIKRSTLIDLIRRIAASVEIPVTADIESGYGESISELEATISEVIDAGVVGINIEDSLREGGALDHFTNDGSEDLVVYVIADNPIGESCHYPDSKKYLVRTPEIRLIRSEKLDYYDGEE